MAGGVRGHPLSIICTGNGLKFGPRNSRANQKTISETTATSLFCAVHAFERVEHNRLLLAAHRERTERATRHADGKRADALNQRR